MVAAFNSLLSVLTLAIGTIALGPSSFAVEPSACLNQLREIIGSSDLPRHFVHPDATHTQMANEFLKATQEVYALLPKEFKRPQHVDLDLISKRGKGSFCNTGEGKIVCEALMSDRIYKNHGVEALKGDLAVHVHELSHLISYENYHAPGSRLEVFLHDYEHPFLKPELEATINADQRMTQAELEYENASKETNERLADQKYATFENLEKDFKLAQARLLRKRAFWQAYDEVFADLIAVSWSKDPQVIAKKTRETLLRTNDARDFSIPRAVTGWISDDVHNDFSPVRSHLWSRYLEKDPACATRLIGATHRALLHEIDATLANPKLYEMSLAQKNQRFIDEVDREMKK